MVKIRYDFEGASGFVNLLLMYLCLDQILDPSTHTIAKTLEYFYSHSHSSCVTVHFVTGKNETLDDHNSRSCGMV